MHSHTINQNHFIYENENICLFQTLVHLLLAVRRQYPCLQLKPGGVGAKVAIVHPLTYLHNDSHGSLFSTQTLFLSTAIHSPS